MREGKCDDCKCGKGLDTMVMKEPGLYRCMDCVVEEVTHEYAYFDNPFSQETIKTSRLHKLMGWCFG